MMLLDVNVLVYAHRVEPELHPPIAAWLTALVISGQDYALSEEICAGLVRVVTNPRTHQPPSTLAQAMGFIEQLATQPNCRMLRGGPRRFAIFKDLLERSGVTGPRVSDAWHASLAIEHGCDFASCDSDMLRFPGLRWHHPLRPRN